MTGQQITGREPVIDGLTVIMLFIFIAPKLSAMLGFPVVGPVVDWLRRRDERAFIREMRERLRARRALFKSDEERKAV